MPLAHKPANLSGGIAAFLICSTLRCPLIFPTLTIFHKQKHLPAEEGRHASPYLTIPHSKI
jgi:hypothetical protein